MDDLSVTLMSSISSITLLNKYSVMNVDVLKEKNASLGMQEALELLRPSLESMTVLTDVFLANKE
ncbi:putative Sec1-like superfamily protein [Dioscorea sansibarensis]